LIVIISIPTIKIVVTNYNNKLYNAVISKMETAASKCINESICSHEKITLKELYEAKYLERIVNPLNKEYFNEDAYLLVKENGFEFFEK